MLVILLLPLAIAERLPLSRCSVAVAVSSSLSSQFWCWCCPLLSRQCWWWAVNCRGKPPGIQVPTRTRPAVEPYPPTHGYIAPKGTLRVSRVYPRRVYPGRVLKHVYHALSSCSSVVVMEGEGAGVVLVVFIIAVCVRAVVVVSARGGGEVVVSQRQ